MLRRLLPGSARISSRRYDGRSRAEPGVRLGVPPTGQRLFFGDRTSAAAYEAASKAVALDPSLAEGYAAAGQLLNERRARETLERLQTAEISA